MYICFLIQQNNILTQIDDPFPSLFILLDTLSASSIDIHLLIKLFVLAVLLLLSALISGSETAFFSLSSIQLDEIDQLNNKKGERIIKLLQKPKQLLATILIFNNFVNVAIVILSAYISHSLFHFIESPTLSFIFDVVIVTFILLLLGEITPKI